MKLMFISDVRNFQFSDSLIKLFKPDAVLNNSFLS